MFSKEDILKQLRDGADPQDIATAMADAINGAIGEFEEEQKAKKEQERMAEQKFLDMRNALAGLIKFGEKYYNMTPITGEDLDHLTKECIKSTDDLCKFADIFKDKGLSIDADADDDVIKTFLKIIE